MSNNNSSLLPFHPIGLPDTQGGVSIEGSKVVLYSHEGQIVAQTPLPGSIKLSDLYRDRHLFRLFPHRQWYIGRPWESEVELMLLWLERSRQVDGTLTFLPQYDKVRVWDAVAHNGGLQHAFPTWDIHVPLPPEYPVIGDVSLQLNLAWHIWKFLGEKVPAEGLPGDVKTVPISNVFTATTFEIPFRLQQVGFNVGLYLAESWAWAGQEVAV